MGSIMCWCRVTEIINIIIGFLFNETERDLVSDEFAKIKQSFPFTGGWRLSKCD